MKVRSIGKRALARLAHNNQSTWYLTPFLLKAETVRKANARIRALMDEAFNNIGN